MPERVHFIAQNRHYIAQVDAPQPGQMLGHDGGEFTITWPDGRVLVSRNVWWGWQTLVPPGTETAEMSMNWPPTFRHGWQRFALATEAAAEVLPLDPEVEFLAILEIVKPYTGHPFDAIRKRCECALQPQEEPCQTR